MSFLQIKNISKHFTKDVPAIKEVSLDVNEGEIVAILGESGCGKTTLMRIIAGFEDADSGEVTLQEQTLVGDKTFVKPEKRGVGIVFQDHSLFPNLTVQKNIEFGISKLSEAERKDIVEELLDGVQLSEYGSRYPHELSGGQQQRVAIARSLAPSPKVMLLDEPFSNIDTELKEDLRASMAAYLKNRGMTVILVSHDVNDALDIADRIGWMRDGKLMQFGTAQELFKNPATPKIAGLFGAYTLLHHNTFVKLFGSDSGQVHTMDYEGESHVVLRPTDLSISVSSGNGKVVKTRFAGTYTVLDVEVEGVVIHGQTTEKVQAGDSVSVTLSRSISST